MLCVLHCIYSGQQKFSYSNIFAQSPSIALREHLEDHGWQENGGVVAKSQTKVNQKTCSCCQQKTQTNGLNGILDLKGYSTKSKG